MISMVFAIFLVIAALIGTGWMLWFSNEKVPPYDRWVFQWLAAGWATVLLVFAMNVWSQ